MSPRKMVPTRGFSPAGKAALDRKSVLRPTYPNLAATGRPRMEHRRDEKPVVTDR